MSAPSKSGGLRFPPHSKTSRLREPRLGTLPICPGYSGALAGRPSCTRRPRPHQRRYSDWRLGQSRFGWTLRRLRGRLHERGQLQFPGGSGTDAGRRFAVHRRLHQRRRALVFGFEQSFGQPGLYLCQRRQRHQPAGGGGGGWGDQRLCVEPRQRRQRLRSGIHQQRQFLRFSGLRAVAGLAGCHQQHLPVD